MSKIIFLSIPAHGHVNPTLPVVQELVQRGEQVIYYNADVFRPQIERAGAVFRPYPPSDMTSTAIAEALQNGNMVNISILIMRATKTLFPFMLDELRREQPDLVVYDSTVMWGKMAATSLKLREAASICHFSFDFAHLDLSLRELARFLGPTLLRLPAVIAGRRQLTRQYDQAFPKTRPLFPMRGGLNLLYTSRELHPATAMIDDTFCFVGPSINPQTRAETFPFEALKPGPLVYISLGTIHNRGVEFYRRCFEAFADDPAQFILSVGKETDIGALGAIPTNFIVRASVPQLDVLSRADVFVTHGGLNSVQEALYYGVPLVVIPHQFEQLFNGRVVASHGAALVLDDALAGREVSSDQLHQAVEAVRVQAGYHEAAQKLQATLRATGGYQQAADEIQRYLGHAA